MSDIYTSRNFITMIRPMLGIEQKKIRKLTITAEVGCAVRCDVECFAVENADTNSTELLNDGPTRRFLFEVTELKDGGETLKPTGVEWIDEWGVGKCPVYPRRLIDIMRRDGTIITGRAGNFSWKVLDRYSDIIKYRIVKE